jgi:hypothetical protein
MLTNFYDKGNSGRMHCRLNETFSIEQCMRKKWNPAPVILPVPGTLMILCAKVNQLIRASSTRRFCALPVALSLVATGLEKPYPLVINLLGEIPSATI